MMNRTHAIFPEFPFVSTVVVVNGYRDRHCDQERNFCDPYPWATDREQWRKYPWIRHVLKSYD